MRMRPDELQCCTIYRNRKGGCLHPESSPVVQPAGSHANISMYVALKQLVLLQVGMLGDDTCRLEWVIPYLLNFVVPDTTSAAKASQTRRLPDRDSVPRAVALRHLHHMWTKLTAVPRSERGLFGAYLVPACTGASDSKSSVLRRELFLALPSLARTAQRLFSAAVRQVAEDSSGVNTGAYMNVDVWLIA